MQRLMPDSGEPKTERGLQPLFRKLNIFSYLALATIVLAVHCWLRSIPNRADLPDATTAIRFTPVRFDPAGFAPLRLLGAWRVAVDDPRFGGVSALAIDRGHLLALTDSGTVIRFPRPGLPGPALVRDLGDGPGNPRFKHHRDSEALARDPAGCGWWVAFESWHQLWLFDADFRGPLRRIDLGRERWHHNRGVEAMIAGGGSLMLFPEGGSEWLQLRGTRLGEHRLANRYGSIADAARLPDGRLLLVTRKLGFGGLAKRLVVGEPGRGGALTLRPLASLGLGPLDNVEAIAIEPRPEGTRLWLMTDNDFRPRAPTLLVALDLP